MQHWLHPNIELLPPNPQSAMLGFFETPNSFVGVETGIHPIQITTVCVSGLCRADLEAHMSPFAWGSWESLGLLESQVTYFQYRGFVVIKWVGEGVVR